jgi:hypothetical protein
MSSRTVQLAIVAALAVSAAPAGRAHAGDAVPGCVDGEAGEAVAAGDDEGPPKFTSDFLRTTFTLDASTDGFSKRSLAISIEDVCNVPQRYAEQAVQLVGSDGVAVITKSTRVYSGKRLLKGKRRRTALDGADTTRLKVRLWQPKHWRSGEEDRVPTFTAFRATITD